jgi:hypothetical protein
MFEGYSNMGLYWVMRSIMSCKDNITHWVTGSSHNESLCFAHARIMRVTRMKDRLDTVKPCTCM